MTMTASRTSRQVGVMEGPRSTGPTLRPAGERSDPGEIRLMGADPLMMRALERLLRRAGYVVQVQESVDGVGDVAGSAVRTAPALLIVDLPDEWSRPARGTVGRTYPPTDLPEARQVLWISNGSEGAGAATEAGNQYLVKPFSGAQLLAAVEAALTPVHA
jgi:DNA-binding NarL/FixJ family response regulator